MPNRYLAILLSLVLAAALAVGLFIEPKESQANPGTGWQGEYFNNPTLTGTPVVVVTDDVINFNWRDAAPLAGVPADNFSVRWTATVNFGAGIYQFRVGADDGIRLFIDDNIVIDQFTNGPFRSTTRDVQLTEGPHSLRVEYFEAGGSAGALVDWTLIQGPVTGITASDEPEQVIVTGDATAHVTAGVLNVRANPNISAARIAQVFLYQRYPIRGATADGSWYLIELRDGRTGWVSSRYVRRFDDGAVPVVETESSTESAAPDIQVNGISTSELKIRVAPRTGAQIGLLPVDTAIRILGRTSSGSWYYITFDGIEGWVFAPFIRLINGRVIDIPIQ